MNSGRYYSCTQMAVLIQTKKILDVTASSLMLFLYLPIWIGLKPSVSSYQSNDFVSQKLIIHMTLKDTE